MTEVTNDDEFKKLLNEWEVLCLKNDKTEYERMSMEELYMILYDYIDRRNISPTLVERHLALLKRKYEE